MDDFEKYLGEQMKNDAFREEWEALQPEHEINLMLIKARQEHHLSSEAIMERWTRKCMTPNFTMDTRASRNTF